MELDTRAASRTCGMPSFFSSAAVAATLPKVKAPSFSSSLLSQSCEGLEIASPEPLRTAFSL